MGYDPLAESLRLISDGAPPAPGNLTRRRRFVPLAVDREGDFAVTLIARRGVSGQPWAEAWTLECREGEWHLLGGGAGTASDDVLDDRPPAGELGGLAQQQGGGAALRNPDRKVPWGAKFIYHTQLRVAAEVDHVEVGDRRLTVASHGNLVVVWTGRRPPQVAAFSAAGTPLGGITIEGEPQRARFPEWRRRPSQAALYRARSGWRR